MNKTIPTRTVLLIAIGIGILFVASRFTDKTTISTHHSKGGGPVGAVYVGPDQEQNSFAEALQKTSVFYQPFHRAGDLMEAGKYEDALEVLDQALQKARNRINKLMVYSRMQKIYQETGNPEKELETIESWFENASEKANNPEFKHRAAEIRALLAEQNSAKKA